MEQPQKTVTVQELQSGMIIREITELSFEYATLDPKTVQFLQTNFKGANAVVVKDTGRETVSISAVQPFDHVEAITDIPSTLTTTSDAGRRN